MKMLHYPVRLFKVTLKNGEIYETSRRCNMVYSEPYDRVEDTYSSSNVRNFIEKYCYYTYTDYTWKFKKYVGFDGGSKKLLIDDIDSIVVSITRKEVPNHITIKDIGKELPYEEFLQFVFDKEQELKSVVTSMSK